MLPLADLRVLDLTRLLPGPFATMVLSDLGAEVLKVEPPGAGDYLRWMPPHVNGMNAGFAALNRNKKSLVVRLDTPEGVEVIRRLMPTCHALVESFRTGYLDRRGLGWEDASRINPRLVYCSMTGYGQTGPYAARAGHDLNFLALSGLGSALGSSVPAVQLGDLTGGMTAVVALLAALHETARTGVGRHLDVSLTDACTLYNVVRMAEQLATGRHGKPGAEVLSGSSVAYRCYRCADGRWLSVGAIEQKFREKLFGALGRPELAGGMLPASSKEELHREMEALFATRTRDEWLSVLGPLDACVEPVLELDEVAEHPLTVARGMVRETADGTRQPASPFHPVFAPGEPTVGEAATRVGAHTREVLLSAGYSEAEIETLAAGGHVST